MKLRIGISVGARRRAGREVDPDHFGLSLPVAFGGVPGTLGAAIARRRPGVAPESLIADGWAGARRMIAAYTEAGLSKFVIRAAGAPPPALEEFIEGFAAELMPLQT